MRAADQPATDIQRNVIDLWRIQLGLSRAELEDIIDAHSAMPGTPMTRKIAGAVITDLHRLRAEQQRRRMPR